MNENVTVFSLTSSKQLTKEICDILGIKEAEVDVNHFADGEILVEPKKSVRGKHVFIIQSTCGPVNENLMEVLICLDACKRASANEVTCVIPYYGYARQDRKARARQPITSRLVADLLQAAGADRVVSIDLHANQIQGFFKIPNDNLTAVDVAGQYFRKKKLENVCIVSPDHGGVVRARKMGDLIPGSTMAIVDKRRTQPNVAEAMNLIGDVNGKNCIIVDDMVDTGGSIVGCVNMLRKYGAADIYVTATHGVLSRNALERIQESGVKEFVVTNTIELSEEKKAKCPCLTVISVAPLLAASIKAIAEDQPISDVYAQFTELLEE